MDPDAAFEGAELADWRTLPPGQRQAWWRGLWSDATALAERYRLALRSGWWQDPIQVEVLAAFCGWLRLYDGGTESDPTGKLQLLWELERLRGVLRAGDHPFDRERDHPAFEQYLIRTTRGSRTITDIRPALAHQTLREEVAAITERVNELRVREHTLGRELVAQPQTDDERDGAQRQLEELRRAIRQLESRQHQLTQRLDVGEVRT